MLIKDRTYRKCKQCGAPHLLTNEVYGCDACKKVLDVNKPERAYLSATVFTKNERTKDLQCCSWRCMLKALKKVKTDYFVSLPFLHYDVKAGASKGMRAKDFFALLK